MANNLKIGNQNFDGISTIEVTNTNSDILRFVIPDTSTSSLQWASGFKDCVAGQSLRVEGLFFTPKGYAFMVCGNITDNTNINSITNSLFYCFYDTITGTQRRAIGYSEDYTMRINPLPSSNFKVFAGGFEYTASSTQIYNVMGQRYFWIAWG